jgi:hypothetical protein
MSRRIRYQTPDDPLSGLVIETDVPPGMTDADATRLLAVRDGFLAALVDDPRVHAALVLSTAATLEWYERRWAGPRPVDSVFGRRLLDELAVPTPWREWIGEGLVLTFGAMVKLIIENPEEALVIVANPKVALPRKALAVLPPPTTWLFTVREGETVDAARARVRTMARQIDATLRALNPPPRRRRRDPKRTPPYQTWGRWVYATRVRRPPATVTALARAHHEALGVAGGHPGTFETHDCRKQVRDGVREAERLLGV